MARYRLISNTAWSSRKMPNFCPLWMETDTISVARGQLPGRLPEMEGFALSKCLVRVTRNCGFDGCRAFSGPRRAGTDIKI